MVHIIYLKKIKHDNNHTKFIWQNKNPICEFFIHILSPIKYEWPSYLDNVAMNFIYWVNLFNVV